MNDLIENNLISLGYLLVQMAVAWALLFILLRFVMSKVFAVWFVNGYMLNAVITAIFFSLGFQLNLLQDAGFKELVVFQLIGLNLVVVPCFYWLDKKKARSLTATRIPEGVLHTFSFVGGAVGALASQKVFRHKTAKEGFRKKTWVALMLNILLFYALSL